jgi:NADH pyrophosphatase NudC (nudix superfamily)
MARYIDADKAVEEARLSYCKDCDSYNGIRCSACGFDDAMMYIEDAPTADVAEVKHGEWALETDEEMPNLMFKLVVCSVCNGKANGTYHYCPHCGAKMDGKKEGTT